MVVIVRLMTADLVTDALEMATLVAANSFAGDRALDVGSQHTSVTYEAPSADVNLSQDVGQEIRRETASRADTRRTDPSHNPY